MAEGEDRVSALALANHLRVGLSGEGKVPGRFSEKVGNEVILLLGQGLVVDIVQFIGVDVRLWKDD